jgi:hypothetical protein
MRNSRSSRYMVKRVNGIAARPPKGGIAGTAAGSNGRWRIAGHERSLRPPVVESPFPFDEVVDLVGPGVTVDQRRLPWFPARNRDVAVRRRGETLVHVVLRRELIRSLQIDDLHSPASLGTLETTAAGR